MATFVEVQEAVELDEVDSRTDLPQRMAVRLRLIPTASPDRIHGVVSKAHAAAGSCGSQRETLARDWRIEHHERLCLIDEHKTHTQSTVCIMSILASWF